MIQSARVNATCKLCFTRFLSSKAGADKKLHRQINKQRAQAADLNSLLRTHREPEMAKLYQLDPETVEVDFNIQERMTDAVESEYRRMRAGMNRATTRRSMERGPQEPNLLTAAQKSELRRLAADDPEHWRPQRLATAFGLSVSGVQRLLKSRWQPTSPKEIERHDQKVAARRRALGLPVPSVQPARSPDATSQTIGRPPGPMTSLLHMFPPPPPPSVSENRGERAQAVSAIYSRDEVLQFPVSDTAGDPDVGMRRLDVPVKVSRKHMTFDELKRIEKNMERRKKLKTNPRLPEI